MVVWLDTTHLSFPPTWVSCKLIKTAWRKDNRKLKVNVNVQFRPLQMVVVQMQIAAEFSLWGNTMKQIYEATP